MRQIAPLCQTGFNPHPPLLAGDSTAADMAAFCPGGRLAAALDYLDTTAVLTDAQALDELQPGTATLIGGEIVRVDAVDVATATLTIARGCADTVPAQHAAGTAVLCYDNWGGDDQTEYTDGVTVDAIVLTNTGAGQLSASVAPVQSVTFAGRAARPYPPGDVKLNGQRYPQEITGDLEITWAHRDRLLQADNLIDALQPSVGPEPGTTYAVELYDGASSTLLHSETGIVATTAYVPSAAFGYDNRLELYSVRDGLESWQRHVRRFTLGDAPTDPYLDKVVALLHFDGDLTDETGRVWTSSGQATIDSSQAVIGSGCLHLIPGVPKAFLDSVGPEWAFGTGDFTLEAYFQLPSLGREAALWDFRPDLTQGNHILVSTRPNGGIYVYVNNVYVIDVTTAVWAPGVWTHVALVRESGQLRLYMAGELRGSATNSANLQSSRCKLGGNNNTSHSTVQYDWDGYIDELRITKGVARYTENFDPPTVPFQNQ